MAEVSDPRIGTLLEGRYRLDTRLAAGGMGVVYKGELVAIGKPVAIKFLHDALAAVPDLVKRFQREATAMSRLAHPHLVSVVDSGLAGGVPFLVMDFVAGRSLAEVLADGPMPAARAATIGKQILAGVKHAHTSGVVHRDLKPDNILMLADVEDDFVKILDFGLAKVVQGGSGDAGTQLTNTGFALGTPGYMSPEQARGTESDERSDLYSVGVILYHMVTGRKPFVADSPLAVLRMHMDDAPTPPTQLQPRCCSPELEKVILRAMAKDPSARFQSAGGFAQALAATPEAREAGFTDEGSVRRRPRGPLPIGLILRALVAVALVVGVAVTWNQLSKRSQQKVKRRLDDAVKMAQGAFEAAKGADNQPVLKKGEPPPPPPKKLEPAPAKKVEAPPQPPSPAPMPAPTPPVPTPKAEEKKAEPPPVVAAKPEPPPVVAAKPEEPTPAPQPPTAEALPDDDDDDTVEEPVAPRDTPGAKLEEAVEKAPPSVAPTPTPSGPSKARVPTTQDATRLIAANRVDEAIKLLYEVRRHAPRSATVALLLGHAYFRKLWRTDGLREYDTAIKLSPLVRHNLLLVRNTVGALEDPTYRLARAVIKARLGTAALSEVRRAARVSKSPRVRLRAARLAQQLAHRRR